MERGEAAKEERREDVGRGGKQREVTCRRGAWRRGKGQQGERAEPQRPDPGGPDRPPLGACESESESHPVLSDPLQLYGL